MTQLSVGDPSKMTNEGDGNTFKNIKKSAHSTLEEEDPAQAYATPATPENRQRDGQQMDVKFMAKDRKRSTPCNIIGKTSKQKALAASTENTTPHQVNHSVGNARASNSSMVKNANENASSMFNSQMITGGNLAPQISVS